MKHLSALAALCIASSATAQYGYLCEDTDGKKTIRDQPCAPAERSINTEDFKTSAPRGRGQLTITEMKAPQLRVDERYEPPQPKQGTYDHCAQVPVDQCDEYRYLSIEWTDCRHHEHERLHHECVQISYDASFERGEKYRCMKARSRAYCHEEDHYDAVRH